jgi:hypothetical protein
MGACNANRRFRISNKSYIGLVPPRTAKGDIICRFFGLATHFVLRRQENDYIVIGKCYIQRLMDEEAMKQLGDGAIDVI